MRRRQYSRGCAVGGGAAKPRRNATRYSATCDAVLVSVLAYALQAVAVMQQAVAGAQRACYDSEGWTNGHGLGCAEYSALRYARRCNARCNMQRSDADGGAPAPMIKHQYP
jgi:hypothetical protein